MGFQCDGKPFVLRSANGTVTNIFYCFVIRNLLKSIHKWFRQKRLTNGLNIKTMQWRTKKSEEQCMDWRRIAAKRAHFAPTIAENRFNTGQSKIYYHRSWSFVNFIKQFSTDYNKLWFVKRKPKNTKSYGWSRLTWWWWWCVFDQNASSYFIFIILMVILINGVDYWFFINTKNCKKKKYKWIK